MWLTQDIHSTDNHNGVASNNNNLAAFHTSIFNRNVAASEEIRLTGEIKTGTFLKSTQPYHLESKPSCFLELEVSL